MTLLPMHVFTLFVLFFFFFKGHKADMANLHLLHADPSAQTWTDITSEVSLYVTHIYAVFYVKHFSW